MRLRNESVILGQSIFNTHMLTEDKRDDNYDTA
jgi:hypothetical protein